ncbi:MAG: anti-sigma factor [Chthoniobacterales bacterium]
MNREEFEDLVISESLGMLTPQETALVESLASSDQEFQKIRDDYAPVQEALAYLAPHQEAPAHLKAKILARIPAAQHLVHHHEEKEESSAIGWTWSSLLAAACIILFAGLALLSLQEGQKPLLVQDMREIPTEYVLLKSQKADEKATAQIKWNGTRRSWNLQAENFPQLPAGKDYQVWIIDPSLKTPVSCGIVKPDKNGKIKATIAPDQNVTQMKAFAISIEKAGGDTDPHVIFVIGS